MKGTTIVAITTPPGEGAIGVIRISGDDALSIIQDFIQLPEKLVANRVSFHSFKLDEASTLDEVLLTYFKAPHSYTGEDVVEISFHGSSYILEQALEVIIEAGAQLSAPGEFTQRAFLNGKLDLSQAEAVADLIASESEAEHRMAMHQMRGGFSKEISAMREQLIHFASLIELELDFSEEDVDFADRGQLIELIDAILKLSQSLIASFKYGNAVKHGVPVVIVGQPNAGKSTLLNALLKEEKAIVTEIAGTTRDAIEDTITLGGIRFRFIDTAGIRDTQDHVEAIGVQRSLEKIHSAAVAIYLFDATEDVAQHTKVLQELKALPSNEVIWIPVANKVDLLDDKASSIVVDNQTAITLSAKFNDGLSELEQALIQKVKGLKQGNQQTVVTNQRHLHALKATTTALEQAKHAIQNNISGDLVAADIREALHHLGSITGEITTDDLLGNIFGKFCIGK